MIRMTQNKTLNTQLMKRIPQNNKPVLILILLLIGCFSSYSQINAPSSVPFEVVPNSTHEIRGELKMIGNTIIAPTIRGNGSSFNPDTPYNFRGVENGSHREYGFIDIDGDSNTESSSSADFERATTCGQIVYAGLYWSATYYDVNQTSIVNRDIRPNYSNAIQPDPREPYNVIKFKPPNLPAAIDDYSVVTADRILYDGYPGSPFNPNLGPNDTTSAPQDPSWPNINTNAVVDMPYHCYADVTDIVLQSTNPDGTYFVADQKATVGPIVDLNASNVRSSSRNDLVAGWTLVIIYEDPSLPRKFISSNYGLAAISNQTGPIDFTYSGFTTLPTPLPVNARYGIGTYEGDQDITGDNLQVEYQPFGSGNFQNVSVGAENLAGNFFDSTITVDGDNYLQRSPASENCLGYDVDIFPLQESNSLAQNVIIGNSQNAVNFRLRTGNDKYQVFVNTFEVEIIAPELVMIKRILRADASQPSGFLDITDGDVNFNEEIFYDITIENVGNEDITNTTIIDVIPDNVDFVSLDIVDSGITPTFNPATFNPDGSINTRAFIELDIDDSVVTEGHPPIRFRFRVRVVEDCAALRDACSNEIENVATSEYTGVISGITAGDSSIVERDVCDFNIVGASTFLINEGTCFDNADTARLCDDRATLLGGDGFDTYEWTRVDDPSDPSFPRDTQDIIVTEPGTYVVNTTSIDCQDTRRQFIVEAQGTPDNPIATIAEGLGTNPNANGNVQICGSTGEEVAEIFLCGSATTLDLDSDLGDTTVWQRLRNGACSGVPRDPTCPTEDTNCDPFWDQVFVGETFVLDPGNRTLNPTGDVSGEYRILTTVDGNCPDEIYFNVFQSNFDPVIARVRDIICGAPTGAIEVTNSSNQYEYQLVFNGTPVGGFQTDRLFDNLANPGSYSVNAREIGAPAEACTFPSNAVTLNEIDPIVEATVTRQPSCITGTPDNTTGRIEVRVTGGLPTYRYVLTDGPAGFIPREITGSSDPTAVFNGLLPGNYTLNAYSDEDDSTTSCFDTVPNLIINPGNPFTVSVTRNADLFCNPDFNPTPTPVPPDVSPYDDDRYIAFVDVTITSTPVSGNYRFSTNPDFSLLAFYITPVDITGNVYRFRFANADSFTIYVQDRAAGCTANGATTINDVVEIEAAATAIDPPCFNEQGAINVDVTAGRAPFTFLIDGSSATPATSPGTADGLGIYTFENIDPATTPTVTIQNGIACDVEEGPLAFNRPNQIQAAINLLKPLDCTADPNARYNVSVSGGSGTYEFSTTSTTSGFTNVAGTSFPVDFANQGNYVVYIRNQATDDCVESFPIVVSAREDVTAIDITPPGNSNCVSQTYTINATAQPAGPSYTYFITPNPASGPATNTSGNYQLTRGVTYQLTATNDANNCSLSVPINENTLPVININSTSTNPVTCIGGNDGVISFTVANSNDFEYIIRTVGPPQVEVFRDNSLSSSVTVQSPTVNLNAGGYEIEVIDRALSPGSNCRATQIVNVGQPTPINFTIDTPDQSCSVGNTITISGVSGGNGGQYQYSLTDGTGGAVTDINGIAVTSPRPITQPYENLPDGTFEIIVTDRDGCPSLPQQITITPLPVPAISLDSADFCLSPDGEVSFVVEVTSLGTGAHSYTLSRDGVQIIGPTNITIGAVPFTFSTTPPPTLTQSGTYQFIITDENGCTSAPLDVIIAEPVELTATKLVDITCNASGDPTDPLTPGSVEFSVSNGYAPSPDYSIEFSTDNGVTWNPHVTEPGPIFTNFQTTTAGTYRFRVTDGQNCFGISGPIQFATPVAPIFNAPQVDLSCFGETGTVTINFNAPNLGDFVLVYDSGAAAPVTNTVTQIPNQGAGTYNYTFTNTVTGCNYDGSVVVTQPDELVITNVVRTNIVCNSGTPQDGSILIDLDGGTPDAQFNASSLTYVLERDGVVIAPTTSFPSPNQVFFEDLTFGFYDLEITDANSCTLDFSFEIRNQVNELLAELNPTGSCATGSVLDVYVRNGTGPFTIEIDGILGPIGLNDLAPPNAAYPPPPAPPVIINDHQVTAGTLEFGVFYTVTIVDQTTSCEYQETFQITPPSAPDVTIVTPTTPEQCDGADDGIVEFIVDNYEVVPGQTIDWEIFRRFDIPPAAPVLIGNVVAPGGPITINSNTDSTPIGGGLAPGQYFVRVTETNGTRLCSTASVFFTIEEAEPIITNPGPVVDGNCNISSTVVMNTTGGNPFSSGTTDGYRYARIDDDGSTTTPVTPIGSLVPANFTFTSNIIDLGTVDGAIFYIAVLDNNNCIQGYQRVVASVDPAPTVAFANPGPPHFVDNPCDYDNDYTFTVNATGVAIAPSNTFIYRIFEISNPGDVSEFIDGASHQFTVTSAGTYRITVEDGNGCPSPPIDITVFDPLEFEAEFTTAPNCLAEDGIITTTLDTGTAAGTLTYVLTGVNGTTVPAGVVQSSPGVFENVPAGEYVVEISDDGRGPGAGCTFTAPVSIEAPVEPVLDLPAVNPSISCNGQADATLTIELTTTSLDNNAVYSYEITVGPTTRPAQPSPTFDNLGPGNYTVVVTATQENGAGVVDDVECSVIGNYTIDDVTIPTFDADQGDQFDCDANPNATIEITNVLGGNGAPYTAQVTRPDGTIVSNIAITAPTTSIEAPVDGTYNVQIFDSNNCPSAIDNVPIAPYTPMFDLLVAQTQAINCQSPPPAGAGDEIVEVSVAGGSGDFIFQRIDDEVNGNVLDAIDTPAGVSLAQFFNLPTTGTYTFRVIDQGIGGLGLNCTIVTTYDVDPFDNIVTTATQQTPESCFGDADGSATITIAGYVGDISYIIYDTDTGAPVFTSTTDLTTDLDSNTADPFTVPPAPTGLSVGSYRIEFNEEDAPFCTDEAFFTIGGPLVEFELIIPLFITTTCDVPLNNGSFTATTNGARGTVTYRIVETGATSTNGTFTDLGPTDPTTPRMYTIIARDTFIDSSGASAFCEDQETIEVRPPADDVTITGINTTDVTCRGDSDGEIEVIATGTDQPLVYTITPVITGVEGARVSNNTFTDLIAGDYIITVYDSSNCTAVTTPPITIADPNPVTIVVDDITDTTCNVTTADVRLTVTSDVAAPYTVEARDVTLRDVISTPSNPVADADRDRLVRQETTNGSGTVTFFGLPEGIYEFFAIDGNTCESQRTGSVVIEVPDQITAELDLSNTVIVCFGDATGSVNLLSTAGGLGNNMYSLDVVPADTTVAPFTTPQQGDPFFTNLAAGQYTYRIESVPGSGCELAIPFEITQPDTPFEAEAIAANITCTGEDDGTITITASGGNVNNPYRFSLFRSNGERVFEFVSDEADNVIGSHVFEELSEDLVGYVVIVEDGLGCRVTIEDLIIEEPAPILIDVTATTGEVCAGDNDGTATFSITGGTADPNTGLPVYYWSIDGINFEPVTDPANLLVEDLPAGTNTIFIRDFNNSPNCETPREFQIDPGVLLVAELEARLICPVWSDPTVDTPPAIITPQRNEVEFTVSPETESLGVIYRLVRTDGSAGPAEYSGFQRVFDVTPGTYDAIMLFEMCERTVGVIEVPDYVPLDVPVVQMTGNPQDPNEYEIIATGGNRLENDPFYTFFVALLEDGGTVNDIQYPVEVDGNNFRVRETGDYLIRVTDANGCEVSVITNLTYINIRIPNYFTPNDPNATPEERFWYPRQITPNTDDPFFFEDMEVKIFDRYGRMLGEFKGDQQGWSGLYQGKELPSGDYWFTVILNDVDNREFTGHFTLYR